MDERIGDILYLLALVAFFVFSSIMKSKKHKKNIPQPEPASEESHENEQEEFPTNFDDFPDHFDDNIIKEEVEIKVERPSTFQKTKTDFRKPAQPKKSEPAVITESKDESTESFWDEEEFDLRKAVIFSEILKRPEL